MQENKKVFDLSWQRLSIAAAAAVMFVSAGILFWMNSHKTPERLASEAHKPVEVNVIDRDSVEAVIKSKDEPVIASLDKKKVNTDRPSISEYKQGNVIQKEEVIAPQAEAAAVASSAPATVGEAQSRSVSAARQAKMARVEGDGAMNQASVAAINAPKSGWSVYNQYLIVAARDFKADPRIAGSVILSFRVGPDGKPANLKVVKSLNEVYDKEALRIVRNGSEWTPSPDGQPYNARIEVNFTR